MNKNLQVILEAGVVEGRRRGDVLTFYGVPYAKAERFCAPKEVSWKGVMQADTIGKRAFQGGDEWNPYPWEGCEEDCLKLNIITPGLEGKRPVLVDIHGGAFQNGGTDDLTKPGEGFLENQEFVFVVPAYRLGVWGFLDLAGEAGFTDEKYLTSGSNGMLDIVAALKWIQKNISAFGGDPENVVITGESAGAKMIGGLMVSPLAEGLFQRVILSSGGIQAIRTKETAKAVFRDFLNCAGVRSAASLAEMNDKELMEAQKKLCAGFSTCHFGPVADGIVIPLNWQDRLHEGSAFHGSALLGCNRNELGFYVSIPEFEDITEQITYGLLGENGKIVDAVIAAVPAELPKKERRQKKCDLISDAMYRTHTYGLANTLALIGAPVWLYSLEGEKATHAADLGLIWTPEDSGEWPNGMEREDALRRRRALIVAYTDFVMKGEAFWHPYTPEVPMIFRIDQVLQEEILNRPDAFMEFPEESLRLH